MSTNAISVVKKAVEKELSYKELVSELAEIADDARKKGFLWREIQQMFRKHQFVVSTATLRKKIKEKKVLS